MYVAFTIHFREAMGAALLWMSPSDLTREALGCCCCYQIDEGSFFLLDDANSIVILFLLLDIDPASCLAVNHL